MGYGETFEKALRDLYTFDASVQHAGRRMRREALKGKLSHREGSLTHLRAGNIPLPEPRSETFEPVTA